MENSTGRSPPPTLTQNTFWMFTSLVTRLTIQAIYFILIARALGPEQYGVFISIKALVSILSPFAGLGIDSLLIKNTSRNHSLFNIYWGNALVLLAILGSGGILILVFVSPYFLHVSIPIILVILIAISDLILEKVVDTASKAFQAFQLLHKTGLIVVACSAIRLVAALFFVYLFSQLEIFDWCLFYLGSSFVAATLAITLVQRDLGPPAVDLSKMRREAAEGFFFSVSMSAQNTHNSLDKIMIPRLSSLEVAGAYGVADRLVNIAMAPVRALLYSTYAMFFKHGERGVRGSYRFARRLFPVAVVYGLLAAAVIYVLAPYIPLILGEKYRGTVLALQWLSLLPLLRTLHFLASDILSGAGRQGTRSLAIIASAFLNFLSNLWLIPLYSWQGAACSALATHSFLAITLWTSVIIRSSNEKERPPEGGAT